MYMDVIIRGAKQNKLPDEYIGYLETLPTNGRHENIDLYTEIIKQLEENDSQWRNERLISSRIKHHTVNFAALNTFILYMCYVEKHNGYISTIVFFLMGCNYT